MYELKQIIKEGLTNTNLNIPSYLKRKVKILSMTCFWSKTNFSAIISFNGLKYYCYYCNNINDIVIKWKNI